MVSRVEQFIRSEHVWRALFHSEKEVALLHINAKAARVIYRKRKYWVRGIRKGEITCINKLFRYQIKIQY